MKGMINFSLNPENIKDTPFDKYENNFTFIVNGKQYKTNRVFADFLSPKLRKLHYIDSSVNELYINTQQQDQGIDYFEDFLKLSTFHNFKLDPQHQKHFAEYFYFLGNVDEYYHIQPFYSSKLTVDNVLDLLSTTSQISIEIPHEIEPIKEMITFISQNFELIDKERIKKLDLETLKKILSNEQLKINDEDSLFQFVLSLYEKDHLKSQLFDYIIFSNISEDSFKKFVAQIKIEDLSSEVWSQVCNRFLSKSEKVNDDEIESRYLFDMKEFKYNKEKEFDGIMKYLTNETGGNIHDNGTIKISSNSIRSNCHPKNLVNFKNTSNYDSLDDGNAKICFDFKEKLIQLQSYTIKTNDNGPNGCHLKNWVIEVSNDRKNWDVIDSHSNDPSLNGPNIISNFEVAKPKNGFYRFVQLRQTGNSWYQFCNHNRFWFFFIEFYGILKKPSNKHS